MSSDSCVPMASDVTQIRIEFVGGYWANKCFDTRSTAPEETQLARAYHRMHLKGTLEDLFYRLSTAAVRLISARGWSTEQMRAAGYDGRHSYLLAEKIETEGDVV